MAGGGKRWLERAGAWLKENERLLTLSVAAPSMLIALLAAAVSLVQTTMLANERSTPYQTARYVRQLEVTENLAGATEDQWLTLSNFAILCARQESLQMYDQASFTVFRDRFEKGSQDLHKAIAAAETSLPDDVRRFVIGIWNANEKAHDDIVTKAQNCAHFNDLYGEQHYGERLGQRLRDNEDDVVCAMRDSMGVERLPPPEAVEEMRQRDPYDVELRAELRTLKQLQAAAGDAPAAPRSRCEQRMFERTQQEIARLRNPPDQAPATLMSVRPFSRQ